MKRFIIFSSLLGALFFNACTKEESLLLQNTYVKLFESDSDVVVVATLPLTDGNYVLVSRDKNELNPGHMVKLNPNGTVLWKKRVSPLTTTLWKVFLIPGTGFASLGFNDDASSKFNVCVYDNEGELLYDRTIQTATWNWFKMPADVLPLQNGNYAIAYGAGGRGYMTITDNAFVPIRNQTYEPITLVFWGNYFRGMCEMADGSIMLTASTKYNVTIADSSAFYSVLMRTSAFGIVKSVNLLVDTGYNETTNCLVNYKEGMLGVSAKMIGLNSGNGMFVNYLNSFSGMLISGVINLSRYDSEGQLLERIEIRDYPSNGQINAIKPTADGGFILCGTVGQANSPALVSNTEIYLLKIDANLKKQWSKSLITAFPSYGVDVVQTIDGGYLVSGQQRAFNNRFQAIAIKTDKNGTMK